MVTIGILVSQLINYGTERFFWGWRVSLGIAVVPALILFIGAPLIPATTRTLPCAGLTIAGRVGTMPACTYLELCRCKDSRWQQHYHSAQQRIVKQPL